VYKDANIVQTMVKLLAASTAGDVYNLWNLGMDLPHVSFLATKFLGLLQDFMNIHDTQQ